MTSNNLPDRTDTATPTRTRDGGGKYAREPETAERDAKAARLRRRGYSYREIGQKLGIHHSSAHEAVQRALRETVQEAGEELRTMVLQRLDEELTTLDEAEQLVRDTLERNHVMVSHGQVVYDLQTGQAIPDDAFILSAVTQLQKIAEQRRRNDESRRKLLGMDQPPKVEVSGGITYQIVGITQADLT